MNLPVQHLSDEAVAAYADGVLGPTARARAQRHVTSCPECAYSVAVQREAVFALRDATVPALPSGLLDRLRAVPTTTALASPPIALSPDGSAAFAAYGTSIAPSGPPPVSRVDAVAGPSHPVGLTPSIAPPPRRYSRLGSVGMATVVAAAAIATLTAGMRMSEGGAGTGPVGPTGNQPAPGSAAPAVAPALLRTPFDSSP
jgi:anti-sigma factor RsiW